MKINIYLFLLLSIFATKIFAQTDPPAQTLPFSFTNQADGVLQSGMAVHKFTAIQTTRTTAVANGDLPYVVAATSGGWNAQNANGIGLLASGTNAAGAVIVAVNTKGKTGITISWKVTTISNAAGTRDNSIALQYRIGTSGIFTDIGTNSTYASNTVNHFTEYTENLPVAAENNDVVQLRWIYWESSGTAGARDRLAVTNINVASLSTPCISPNVQPTSMVFGTINDVSIAGSFTAANPTVDEYIVVRSINDALTSNPVDGQVYAIGDGFGDGVVVAKGPGVTFSSTGLSPSTNYYYFVFSLNSACTGGPKYLVTNPLVGNGTTTAGLPACSAPANQPTNLTFNNVTVNSIKGNFIAPATAADEYLVLRSLSSSLTNTPINGTVYNINDALGNAVVVQRNNLLNFSTTGLSANTAYYFFVFALNSQSCTNGPVYNIAAPLNNTQSTLSLPVCVKPSAQPTSLLLNPSNNSVAGSFTAASGTDDYLIIRSTSPSLSAQPNDNIDYNVGDNIGGGTVIVNSNTLSFLSGSLTASTTYYFFVYSVNKNCTGGTKYLTTNPLAGNTTTSSTPANKVYFGTLHSHSHYSDGNKDNASFTPADDYAFAINSQCLDYLGISEHNHYTAGNIITNYHKGSIQANDFTAAHSNFVALYGMEWGVISGGGHVIVYGDGMDNLFGWETNVGGVVNNYDVFIAKNDYTGPSGLFKTINDNVASNTFATLAHPNSSDYGNIAGAYNPTADLAIVGAAVESGPAFSTSTTYSDPATSLSYLSYYKTLLSRGYHVGPTVDHDNHNTTFGRATYSRTAIIAPSLSKTELVKAMRNMHFYATQDCDSKVDFTINTKMMGSVFSDRNAPVISLVLSDATTSTSSAVIKIMFGNPSSGITPAEIYSYVGNVLNFTDNNLSDKATGYYYADITNGSSRIITSPIWYTRNDAMILPVKLSLFEVKKYNSSVKVFWTTAQEVNSNYFTVQSSKNGRDWKDVSNINAAGNSNVTSNYLLVDNAPSVGVNFYRLKQVDVDGRIEYSTIKSVVFDDIKDVLITPNPATDYIDIYLSRSNNSSTNISLFTANGELVKQYVTNNLSYKINVANLPKGMYILNIVNNDKVITQKIIKQ